MNDSTLKCPRCDSPLDSSNPFAQAVICPSCGATAGGSAADMLASRGGTYEAPLEPVREVALPSYIVVTRGANRSVRLVVRPAPLARVFCLGVGALLTWAIVPTFTGIGAYVASSSLHMVRVFAFTPAGLLLVWVAIVAALRAVHVTVSPGEIVKSNAFGGVTRFARSSITSLFIANGGERARGEETRGGSFSIEITQRTPGRVNICWGLKSLAQAQYVLGVIQEFLGPLDPMSA